MHQFESYLERFSSKHSFYSLLEKGGLKINFEIGISIFCFQWRPQQVSFRALWCQMFWLWRMKITKIYWYMCIFPILPVNVPWSYFLHCAQVHVYLSSCTVSTTVSTWVSVLYLSPVGVEMLVRTQYIRLLNFGHYCFMSFIRAVTPLKLRQKFIPHSQWQKAMYFPYFTF